MTCRPVPLHPLDALYQAARRYPGGVEALARRLNMSEPTLYKKLRHQVETHRLAYDDELSELLFCLKEAGVKGWADTLHALLWRHGHVAIALPEMDAAGEGGEALTAAIVSSVKEHAEAIASIGESLQRDSAISDFELRRIEKEIEEAVVALVGLRDLARKMNEAARPNVQLLPKRGAR
jgi:AraC-like DNA-binding protein